MRLPPFSYNLRSLMIRRAQTFLTVIGIGATVAVLAGVLALQQGFATLYQEAGRDDVAVFMRPGATSEGESAFQLSQVQILKKELPEIALDAEGVPLAAGELYLAIRREKLGGGETNVPFRGVEPMSFAICGDKLKMIEGRRPTPGNDELIVGQSLAKRIKNCQVGKTMTINTTPFAVVGVFAYDGPFQSEVWGDRERVGAALERDGVVSRVVAKLQPGTDVEALAERLESDKQVPAKVLSERAYLSGQTAALSYVLIGLGTFLSIVMGTAAVFTGTNTMFAALAQRAHEIGVLLAIGFRPFSIFLSFVFEALLLGLLGGITGCLLVLPLHGVRTGTTNFQTFTEVAFAFRVTPWVLGVSVTFAVTLGLIGGLLPAWSAARRDPIEALRRQ